MKLPNEQDHQVCDTIRKQIENKKYAPPHKIPIEWFLLEQDIIKLARGGVISKKECLSIAALLNINAPLHPWEYTLIKWNSPFRPEIESLKESLQLLCQWLLLHSCLESVFGWWNVI